MEFTFHSSYVILKCVLSTVIFWTELCCWHKCYSKGWTNRYKQSTVVITIWLTVTKYPYHNFPYITSKTSTGRYDFRIKYYVLFAFTSSWYLIYVICVCLRIDVFNTYCVVFLFCIVLSCALCAVYWFGQLLITTSVFSNVYFIAKSDNLMYY